MTCVEGWAKSKKLDPTHNTNPEIFLPKLIKIYILINIIQILMVCRGSKGGTLPPCWDHAWGEFWAKLVKILVVPSPNGYILQFFEFSPYSFELIYSIDTSRMIGHHEILNFNQLFLKSDQFICN
jgi:hypothetical protein